ncbi:MULTISPECIES: 5,6-dimethylbenzimidazole synthase [unclassified Novosphingobium]|uniref:5,6-dimethylbenzimidazole synthase n=1 Tax=unclassified Novosphingobium TaxID=2644732 RepID=UPI001882099E|nr:MULTISPECIES: 5,6-dimethylbenzimidazole synthase [unclassified Novosphingobium]MCW1384544.1 5,6-dimethylbenzimidazole synthase [Novosphingobium sp. KCTC 2891]QOV96610.1 5,6-dimethylbenzimidazole synthase [Novosphingobium sp. ES2-1]
MSQPAPQFDAEFAQAFETLLHWRRDVRHFASQPVTEQDMAELLALATLAPSVGNAQPWRFVRVRTPALREALAVHVDDQNALAARGYADQARHDAYRALKLHGLREAPEIVALFCDEQAQAGHRLGIATMPEMLRYSCVAAIQTLWLAARIRGIGLGWVSILDPQVVSAMLDVPPRWSLIALLCIGYPEQSSETPELEQRGWQSREPLADRVFER